MVLQVRLQSVLGLAPLTCFLFCLLIVCRLYGLERYSMLYKARLLNFSLQSSEANQRKLTQELQSALWVVTVRNLWSNKESRRTCQLGLKTRHNDTSIWAVLPLTCYLQDRCCTGDKRRFVKRPCCQRFSSSFILFLLLGNKPL